MPITSPIAVTAGVAMSTQHPLDGYGPDRELSEPALELSVGYRHVVSEPHRIAITLGAIGGLSHHRDHDEQDGNILLLTTDRSVDTLDVGVVAALEIDWVWIAPWIGRHVSWGFTRSTQYTCRPPACMIDDTGTSGLSIPTFGSGGVITGVDVWRNGPHRLSLFANLQTSATLHGYHYSALGIGIAYRL